MIIEWHYGAITGFNTTYGLGLILNWSGSPAAVVDLITTGDKEMTLLGTRDMNQVGGKDASHTGYKDSSLVGGKDITLIGVKDI